ncbi:hypothetical protein Taro_054872 [Colocasia esculenta]|uniref:Uncharacterized protein n=1 Tax=Colocasia esculenta TaxID=4460 RepID=A0A843XSJ8_COLES|nr:hypothetical protein [Colocasia esculenta]
MGRISAQQGRLPSFQRFLFREFHLGHISSEVLAPLLSECERLSPTDWEKHYNQSALQLEALNSSLFKVGKPTLTAEAFLDLNSINLVKEPYDQWVEQYKLFMALKKDLLQHQIHYPIKINQFLRVLVLCRLEPGCIALYLEWLPMLVALSVVRQALAVASVPVSLSLWERVCLDVVPCFGLGPSEVDVLSSTSTVVSIPV